MLLTVMVEGQEGVEWADWQALARAAEHLGFEGLLRSDHYHSVEGDGDRGALDAWGTVNALAAVTQRIRLGTLVSPVTFRPAAVLAKLALTADHVSGGRIDVGMGTGWWEAEHEAYGLPFPPLGQRMDELARQLGAVTRFWSETRPAPVQRPRPRIVMGGQARPRSATLAARYADEYNVLFVHPDEARRRFDALRRACEGAARDPATLRLSLMTGFVLGGNRAEVRDRARRLMRRRGEEGDPDAWLQTRVRENAWIVGTAEDAVERLAAYAAVGVERVMLQHHLFRDLDVLELIGQDVSPRLPG